MGFFDLKLSVLFFLCCVGVRVYGVIFRGWASGSKYALLGALRAVAQTVSYELIFSFLFFVLCFFYLSYRFSVVGLANRGYWFFFLVPFLCFRFILTRVVETNRAPFDLAEGESELVSGFNVEYGGLKFSLIFLGEYASIIWMCYFLRLLLGSTNLFFFFLLLFLVYLFFFFRSSYPRVRYDFLMRLM
jgi:NADH:ubiquinone oxidoreductase subunit H